MAPSKEELQKNLEMCIKIIRLYDWLLDLYVLDFFVDDHWSLLPLSWRECLKDVDPQDLGHLLSKKSMSKHVLPLSLMSLLTAVEAVAIERKPQIIDKKENVLQTANEWNNNPKLNNLFLKHVKLKKRHEISLMADVVGHTAMRSNCDTVIDFGSGLGHLVRMLSYKYYLHSCGVECQTKLTEEARKLDMELEYTVKKYIGEENMSRFPRPSHFNLTLTTHDQLLHLDMSELKEKYGLVGLHPCGDLGPLLLKYFVTYEQVKFMCLVGCCYMKLTENGYPMSNFLKSLDNKLSYTAREISCHAIEVYSERLMQGIYEDLKIHAYRAAFERLLVNHDPKLRHSPVRSIKHTDSMTFERYCALALERISPPISISKTDIARGLADLSLWKRVVALYSLRLALAPLVETVVLYDRVLFVMEHGFNCDIHPVFDPKISARNHILIARRS